MKYEKHFHLSYHYISDGDEKKPGPVVSKDLMRAQFQALAKKGYSVMDISMYARALLTESRLPERVATLSFDDGLRDGYRHAFPLLKSFGYPASFLIILCTLGERLPPAIAFQILISELGATRIETEILPELLRGSAYETLLDQEQYDIRDAKAPESPEMRRIKWIFNHFLPHGFQRDLIDKMFIQYLYAGAESHFTHQYFMNVEELRTLHGEGFDIVSHSFSHPAMNTCGTEVVLDEIVHAKKILDAVLPNKKWSVFAWPFGGTYDEEIKRTVSHYHIAAWNFYANRDSAPSWDMRDLFNLPRVDAASVSPEDF